MEVALDHRPMGPAPAQARAAVGVELDADAVIEARRLQAVVEPTGGGEKAAERPARHAWLSPPLRLPDVLEGRPATGTLTAPISPSSRPPAQQPVELLLRRATDLEGGIAARTRRTRAHWRTRRGPPRGRRSTSTRRRPRRNTAYWLPKLARNVAHDARVRAVLEAQGWAVLIVWERAARDPARHAAWGAKLRQADARVRG